LAEVHLVQIADSLLSIQEELEVMMAKRERSLKETMQTSDEDHREKRSKSEKVIRKPRRRIGISNLLIGKGQTEYSILDDLDNDQSTNITMGQLIAKCPALRKELRLGISTRRCKPLVEIHVVDKAHGDLRALQVEAKIHGHDVEGCLIY